jgi:multidrug efflux pump subunit AcrA (membrane-fusion protein)
VAEKQAQVDEARTGLEEYALKAPVDGTVLRVLVSPGDVLGVQPKQPAVLFCPDGRRIAAIFAIWPSVRPSSCRCAMRSARRSARRSLRSSFIAASLSSARR